MKIAWVTPVAPPTPSGQSRVLGALLDGLDDCDSILFTDDERALRAGNDRPCKYVALPQLQRPRFGFPALNSWLQKRHARLHIEACAELMQRQLSAGPVSVIVGCTASRTLLAAAWLVSHRLNVPFVAYLFDDPVKQWQNSADQLEARRWELMWSAEAAAIVTPNEVLAADVQARCGIKCDVVRNCISKRAYSDARAQWPLKPGELSIVYTGAVYHAHFDAFINLVNAIDRVPIPTTLHVYTDQDESDLRRQGINGSVVYHPHLPSNEIFAIQHQADILFLPMAFNSPIPEVIRSSAPGKLGEYLASGRPILVHAPAESFASTFHRERHCGFVVDAPSPDAIANAIMEICEDSEARNRVVRRSTEEAVAFSAEVVCEKFGRILSSVART